MRSAIVLGRFAVLYFMDRLVHALYAAMEGRAPQQLFKAVSEWAMQ